ncbi:hypothetical protein JB92DRAFT_3120803 [Gautieria morchelliformis]|nr:hypothetical protein JB92DRAFT_3120803 [Gautieria morchelliformis]
MPAIKFERRGTRRPSSRLADAEPRSHYKIKEARKPDSISSLLTANTPPLEQSMTEEACPWCRPTVPLTVEQHTWHGAPPLVAPHHHEWMSSQRLTGPGSHAAPGEGALPRPGDGQWVIDLFGPIRTTRSYSGLGLALGSDATGHTPSSAEHMLSEHTSASMATFPPAPCDGAGGSNAIWHNATQVPLGLYPANNINNMNHNEGWAQNTAAEPPTATAMESLSIIQMEMLSPPPIVGDATSGALPQSAFPCSMACLLPAPSPQTHLFVSSPQLTIHDGPCHLQDKTGRQCLYQCSILKRSDFYHHLFYDHIGSEMRSITERCWTKDTLQVLTTVARIERAKDYMWRCPEDNCLWSTRKGSVTSHIEKQHTGVNPERAWRVLNNSSMEGIVVHILEA